MKKFYTIASALMLALGMTAMTACSSENDPVIEEQLAELTTRTVTLQATAQMGELTRVSANPIDDKDAFRITGWNDGDKVIACYVSEDKTMGEVTFTYNATTNEFSAEVPGKVELSYFKYAYTGALSDGSGIHAGGYTFINMSMPAVMAPEATFLCGPINTSADGKSLSAVLSAPYPLACVHNNTDQPINIVPYTYDPNLSTKYQYYDGSAGEPSCSVFKYFYALETTESSFTYQKDPVGVLKEIQHPITVPAGEKVYIPLVQIINNTSVNIGLINVNTGYTIASPKFLENGKVYKVEVDPLFAKGTAKRKGDIYVTWVQLWEGGPKFAEYNVGAESNQAGDFGGYYTWGGSTDHKGETGWHEHDTGSSVLSGDHDTATKLWGSAWRMPTLEELRALFANCDWSDVMVNGVYGYRFSGKGDYSSNSLFFPSDGYCYGYWSSTPYRTGDDDDEFNDYYHHYAWFFTIKVYKYSNFDYWYRYENKFVRAVLKD